MYSYEVKKFGVIIIESLNESDRKTGKILNDELLTYKKIYEPNLTSEFYEVRSKKQLLKLLKFIIWQIVNDKFFPILHIEMHGYNDGLALNNGDKISWSELMPFFRQINYLIKNLLVIHLGVCFGMSMIQYIRPDKRAPFRSIIGGAKIITTGQVEDGFHAFYDHFFFSLDTVESIKKLQEVIGGNEIGLVSISYCYNKITIPDFNSDIWKPRLKQMAILKKNQTRILKNMPLKSVEKLVQIEVGKIFSDIRKKEDYFFMRDIIDEKKNNLISLDKQDD